MQIKKNEQKLQVGDKKGKNMNKNVKKLSILIVLALVFSIMPMNSLQSFAATNVPNLTNTKVVIDGSNATVLWTDINKVSDGHYRVFVKGPNDTDYGKDLSIYRCDSDFNYDTTFTVSDNGVYSVKVEFVPNSAGMAEPIGCFEKTFAYVKMSAPKSLTAKTAGYTSINLTWSKVSNADGYYIYRSNLNQFNFKRVKTITSKETTSYTNTGLTKSKAYDYYVVPYGKVGSLVSTSVKSSTKTARAGINKVDVGGIISYSKKIKIDMSLDAFNSKIDSVKGYKIYRATSKTGTYKLVKTIATTKSYAKYINSGLTAGKKYYYKVKAYRVTGGKTYYSDYSSPQGITVTKKTATQVNARKLYKGLCRIYGTKKVKVNNIYSGKDMYGKFAKKGQKVVVIDAYLTDSKGKKSRTYTVTINPSDPSPYLPYFDQYAKMITLTSKTKMNKSQIIKW